MPAWKRAFRTVSHSRGRLIACRPAYNNYRGIIFSAFNRSNNAKNASGVL
jgi:hypothetical protein